MLAISVFTFGTALLAAGSAFSAASAAGQGFISSFIAGGKAFVTSLLGTQGGSKAGAGGGAGTGGGEVVAEGASMAQKAITEGVPGGALTEAANTVAGPGGMGGMPNLPVPAGANPAMQASTGIAPATSAVSAGSKAIAGVGETGNWLTRAAKGAWDFAKSDSGQNLIGSALEGYSQSVERQADRKFEGRFDRMWKDPAQTQAITDQNFGFIPDVWNRDPAALANQRNRNYTPSVQYSKAVPNAGG